MSRDQVQHLAEVERHLRGEIAELREALAETAAMLEAESGREATRRAIAIARRALDR